MLIEQIIQRIDVATDAITITLDSDQVADRLGSAEHRGIDRADNPSPLRITVPAKLKRSGMAMRLILPGGDSASSRIDKKLVKAIATAHGWWEELLQEPELRVSDLAASHGVSKSWITRTPRLAFLDPAIVQQVLDGTAPAHVTLEALRSPDSIPTLWSAQRAHHHIHTAS